MAREREYELRTQIEHTAVADEARAEAEAVPVSGESDDAKAELPGGIAGDAVRTAGVAMDDMREAVRPGTRESSGDGRTGCPGPAAADEHEGGSG